MMLNTKAQKCHKKEITGEKGNTFSEAINSIDSTLRDIYFELGLIKLPRDKDGEVIHIGDTVWFDGEAYQVLSIRYDGSGLYGVEIYIRSAADMFRAFWRKPSEITHAKPISEYERIAQEIEDIADANKGSVTEEDLRLVAEEIRELGDDND